MEDWAKRAIARWPNVPALFGWLHLDRRGGWHIRGESISRPQIIDTINANYEADAQGRWFFQNGPQRGYVSLEYAPLVLRSGDDARLYTQAGAPVRRIDAAWLDEDGTLIASTEHGPAALDTHDLAWLVPRLHSADSGNTMGDGDEQRHLEQALALPDGSDTGLQLAFGDSLLPLGRMDSDAAPERLGFVREPQPSDGETQTPDDA